MSTSFFLTSVCRADELSDFWFMLSAERTGLPTFGLLHRPNRQREEFGFQSRYVLYFIAQTRH
ncbi:hypothetical protein [Streptococcus anginosus]|uniref:hypothetical protein n=1 Tax=Streptococcus anginosus TaxID=1328 RepID=UPI001159793F|nr:hypothetical protein [Streptococcus anginosus]